LGDDHRGRDSGERRSVFTRDNLRFGSPRGLPVLLLHGRTLSLRTPRGTEAAALGYARALHPGAGYDLVARGGGFWVLRRRS
jgi:hypothetical protein